jgi:thiamine-monophosphate kinase
MISERECIDLISRFAHKGDKEYLIKGIGDDCAVLTQEGNNCLLLTTDTLMEGVHFDLAYHPPYLLGRKCASVNLSDIAAMGGRPRACLLSMGFPGKIPVWLDDYMQGFVEALQVHDTLLVGGDTVMSRNDTVFSVTILGEVERHRVCYRSGAKPGDMIWVSGSLGNAAAGLELCRRGFGAGEKDPHGKWQHLIKDHLDPDAQVGLGNILAGSGLVHAMLDVSDGLATDMAHLCQESGVGAQIKSELLPVEELLNEAAAMLDITPMDWVLRGGEDYQLLFTTDTTAEEEIRRLTATEAERKTCAIGRIVRGEGVIIESGAGPQEISFQGYEHFRD